jgi:hypothetical protein
VLPAKLHDARGGIEAREMDFSGLERGDYSFDIARRNSAAGHDHDAIADASDQFFGVRSGGELFKG